MCDGLFSSEAAATSLKSAGETISNSLLIAMVLKGLPEECTPFNTVVMQKDSEPTFLEFKSLLRSYEESLRSREAHRPNVKSENVLKVNYKKNPDFQYGGSASGSSIRCYSCGKPGHKSFECKLKKDRDVCSVLVDCGATTHIITDKSKFKCFDEDFDESKHMVELADGARCKNIVKGKAVSKGATVSFNPNHSELISPNGVSFEINKKGKLYYLNNVSSCKSRSLEEWHQVLGHCNVKDILKLEDKAEDDYSGSVFVYFLKQKSDALNATKKFPADTSSYGVVKRLRCDNGGEFTSSEFKEFLEGGESEDSESDSDNENVICNEKKTTVNDNQSDPVSKPILVEDEHSEINADLTETERKVDDGYMPLKKG
ncbi:uncharacterized protein [Macrobrachium rosenbergii]|uniref:uncharacterized protein n=1 Tax=Macrobrachium rosenbergii TaxID=79674 RepID=UPI0034D55BAC